MSRYIEADALKENCYKKMDELMESTSEHLSVEALSLLCGFTLIDSAPSIDIVFCKECRYFIDNLTEDDTDEAYDACRWDWKRQIPRPDDFCSYGEREGER